MFTCGGGLLYFASKRGCSSVVERHVANVNVVGSSPITRFCMTAADRICQRRICFDGINTYSKPARDIHGPSLARRVVSSCPRNTRNVASRYKRRYKRWSSNLTILPGRTRRDCDLWMRRARQYQGRKYAKGAGHVQQLRVGVDVCREFWFAVTHRRLCCPQRDVALAQVRGEGGPHGVNVTLAVRSRPNRSTHRAKRSPSLVKSSAPAGIGLV